MFTLQVETKEKMQSDTIVQGNLKTPKEALMPR